MTAFPSSAAPAAATAPAMGGPFRFLRRIEAWLDHKGRAAWIAAMVLAFIFVWPLGLFLAFYITWTNRWSSETMFTCAKRRHHHHRHHAFHRAMQPSGNSAFDSYKTDMLKRLEDEQTAFESFLQRLRDAKDKSEFDAFMDDRAKQNRAADAEATDTARSGEY
jgi:Protein of unknown function (DUF2852)